MIQIDKFSKTEIFKFESNFQVKIHKKSNKSKKFFAAARLAAAAHASAWRDRAEGIFFWDASDGRGGGGMFAVNEQWGKGEQGEVSKGQGVMGSGYRVMGRA